MNINRRICLGLALLTLAGCGGAAGSDSDANIAPSISNLSYGPGAVNVNDGGGEVTVSGSFEFTEPDGDLRSATLNILDSAGNTASTSTANIQDASGATVGMIEWTEEVSTRTADAFTLQIFVTDSRGNRSNTLSGQFRVTEFAWVSKAPMPSPRTNFATATLNDQIYVIGGADWPGTSVPPPPVSTVEIYDPSNDSWTTGPALPEPLTNQMAVTVNGKIYAIGGHGQFLPGSLAVQEFDPATQTWTSKASMPDDRIGGGVAVYDDRIYIAGGGTGGMETGSLLWFEPATNSWGAGSPMNQIRVGAAGAAVDGRIIVYGGRSTTFVLDGGYLRSLERYDPLTDRWSAGADGNPRRDHGVAGSGGLLYAFGGHNVARALDWVDAYDPVNDSWHFKSSMPAAIDFVQAQGIGEKIYVFGTSDTFEYTPSNDIY